MLISEIQGVEARVKMNALAHYIKSRLDDTESDDFISRRVFMRMASNIGIPISNDTLDDLISQPPLAELISSMDERNIYFNSVEQPDSDIDFDFDDEIDSESDLDDIPPDDELPSEMDSIDSVEPEQSVAPTPFQPETPERRVEKMAKRSLSRRS